MFENNNNNKIEPSQQHQSRKCKVSCMVGTGNSKSNIGVAQRKTRGIKRGSSL